MRLLSLAGGLVATAATAVNGCGLTADFSGLQGGTRVTIDASAPADDATIGAGDAGAPSDAGLGFCASLTTPVKLCTDFDEGAPVDAGWGATDVYGGEAISVDNTAFSPPGAFLSAVNPSGAPSSARLLQTVPTDSASVHVEFEVLLVPSDGTFELGVIHEVIADGTTYGLYYREVDSALQVELRTLGADGSVFDQTWPIGAPPAGWMRVDLDIEVSASGSFAVQHDGQVVASATGVPTSTPSRTAMFVELGFYTFAPGSGEARFDNAIVDWPGSP